MAFKMPAVHQLSLKLLLWLVKYKKEWEWDPKWDSCMCESHSVEFRFSLCSVIIQRKRRLKVLLIHLQQDALTGMISHCEGQAHLQRDASVRGQAHKNSTTLILANLTNTMAVQGRTVHWPGSRLILGNRPDIERSRRSLSSHWLEFVPIWPRRPLTQTRRIKRSWLSSIIDTFSQKWWWGLLLFFVQLWMWLKQLESPGTKWDTWNLKQKVLQIFRKDFMEQDKK